MGIHPYVQTLFPCQIDKHTTRCNHLIVQILGHKLYQVCPCFPLWVDSTAHPKNLIFTGSPMSDIMVDDYTRRGLFNHLLTHDGRALCAHEEMSALFDTIQKRQLELSGERQLYCRLYDAGKWTNVTGTLFSMHGDALYGPESTPICNWPSIISKFHPENKISGGSEHGSFTHHVQMFWVSLKFLTSAPIYINNI